jgi:hypothetical protein
VVTVSVRLPILAPLATVSETVRVVVEATVTVPTVTPVPLTATVVVPLVKLVDAAATVTLWVVPGRSADGASPRICGGGVSKNSPLKRPPFDPLTDVTES